MGHFLWVSFSFPTFILGYCCNNRRDQRPAWMLPNNISLAFYSCRVLNPTEGSSLLSDYVVRESRSSSPAFSIGDMSARCRPIVNTQEETRSQGEEGFLLSARRQPQSEGNIFSLNQRLFYFYFFDKLGCCCIYLDSLFSERY